MTEFFNSFLTQFHFLRPLWLISFLPLLLLLLWAWRQHKSSQSWLNVIDEKLQPFVLTNAKEQRGSSSNWLSLLAISALIICVISLAGPVWQQLPQTVYKPQSALVIVLDLSRSMDAQDIKPTRLTRAKLKIIDLLNARTEGQSALIVYAAQAFTVSPLTDDNDTIIALLNSLSTDIMPSQGSRMDIALEKSQQLMSQAGIPNGHILVVSDGVTFNEFEAIKKLNISKHKVSVLAVGTEQGAPITLTKGGYLKDSSGKIVVARMNRHDLLSLATAAEGVFATLRNDDDDINALLDLMSLNRLDSKNTLSDKTFDTWYEHGSWLLLLAVPMVLMVFRKGFLVFLVVLVLPISQPAEAFDWQQWFKNSDQKAAEQFNKGEFDAAGQQFNEPNWRAAAHFKNKQFDDALQHYDESKDLYNKGNALAKMERYEDALKAWNDVLKANPKHEDAAFNKKQLEEFLKQQQQDQKQDEQSKDNKEQQKDDKQQEQKESDKQEQSDQQKDDQQQQQASDEEKSEQQKQQEKAEKEEQENKEAKDEQQQEQKDSQSEEEKDQQKTPEQLAAEEKLKEQINDPLDEETKQWLRRVPDDPGGLMRNKFRYQYKQLNRQKNEQNPW